MILILVKFVYYRANMMVHFFNILGGCYLVGKWLRMRQSYHVIGFSVMISVILATWCSVAKIKFIGAHGAGLVPLQLLVSDVTDKLSFY